MTAFDRQITEMNIEDIRRRVKDSVDLVDQDFGPAKAHGSLAQEKYL